MSTSVHQGGLYVNGPLTAKTMTPPTGSVDDNAIAAGANIDAGKLRMRRRSEFRCPDATPLDGLRQPLTLVHGATGDVVRFAALLRSPCTGGATVTVDLRKNGTTILTGVITLSSSQAAYEVVEAAGYTSMALAAGDVLELVFAATLGGGAFGAGMLVQLVHDEDAA